HDPRVHPHAVDVAGDGVDGNCLGGDPEPDALRAALGPHPSSTPDAPRRDLVLVTIDSLREDHTSLAGYRWPTTPALAALAARGVRFDGARSPAPLTRRAVPALLYGRMAATLPWTPSHRWPLVDDNQLPTLATTLADAGYRTAAIVSHRDLPLSAPTYRGFAEVIPLSDELVSRHHDNADAVVDRALAWLAAPAGGPRFLWIHLIDPHYPYRPPAAAPALGPGASAYDREIAFADAQVARLLAALSADRTIVAVTADHGEALGDHHRRFHGRGLDEGETHIPLVIAMPGGPATATAAPVSLIDLAPTFLDLVGLDAPAGMSGVSLAATVRTGAPPPDRPVLTELFDDGAGGRELLAVHVGARKLVRDLAAGTDTAYDLARDPHERSPLTDAAALAALRRALAAAADRDLARLPP
ncbi:MAG TPA: sulfatase, partial [Kofleriaceae bacterium]|nr:sulfatase [Kofleriaceae bacterium]